MDLHLDLADLVLDALEEGMLAEFAQVGVPGQPGEVVITQLDGFFQGGGGEIEAAGEE